MKTKVCLRYNGHYDQSTVIIVDVSDYLAIERYLTQEDAKKQLFSKTK